MSDLIYRASVLEAIDEYERLSAVSQTVWNMTSLREIVQQLPSAQPERKNGKWIEVDDYYNRISGRCSICGWEALMYETDVVGMNFCPNCGADMRGEQDG